MIKIAINSSHDSTIAVRYPDGRYQSLELERFVGIRYWRWATYPPETWIPIIDDVFAKIKEWGGGADFDPAYAHIEMNDEHLKHLQKWGLTKPVWVSHHTCHALAAYYQSPFQDALIFSHDGGASESDGILYWTVSKMEGGQLTRLGTMPQDMGTAYLTLCIPISEITKHTYFDNPLSYAGKCMGLAGYGRVQEKWLGPIKNYYRYVTGWMDNGNVEALGRTIGVDFGLNALSGQMSYDLAATSQRAFEEVAYENMQPWLEKYPNLPICISGGCALNVIYNERLRRLTKREIFVPPNPNDCGISIGALWKVEPPTSRPYLAYSGFPILDKADLEKYVNERGGQRTTLDEVASFLVKGKIVGFVSGDSEVGPRALGHRSILCDPAIKEMKDTLNLKVKHREWYRPFAPMVREERAPLIFEGVTKSPFMSFAPKVRREFQSRIPAVVHIDGTARLQTVSRDQNLEIYRLLHCVEQLNGIGVILNTSFNVRGKPILTTLREAFEVLDKSDMDMLYVEGWLFKKPRTENELSSS